METIGINLTHDGSVCHCTDGEITSFLEEERLSGIKHDALPVLSFRKLISQGSNRNVLFNKNNTLLCSGLESYNNAAKLNNDGMLEEQVYFPFLTHEIFKCKSDTHLEYEFSNDHHLWHSFAGFYNSGFDEAVCLIVDGIGNRRPGTKSQETLSVFHHRYPDVCNYIGGCESEDPLLLRTPHYWKPGIGMIYSAISYYLGFGQLGNGKLMGLSSYGREDYRIESFLNEEGFPTSIRFSRDIHGCLFHPYGDLPPLPVRRDFWQKNEWTEEHQLYANLAYRCQKDFETYMIKAIQMAIDLSGSKNVVLGGGCALNCMANYEYLKYLPNGVKLFVDPVCSDAGTSIGMAKYLYYRNTKSPKKTPLKSLYLGPE